MKKKHLIFMICAVLLIAFGVAVAVHRNAAAPRNTSGKNSSSQSTTNTGQTAAKSTPKGFNKQQYSLTDPTSLWVIVNKSRPLSPKTYAPGDLVVPNIPLRANITSTEKYVRADMAKALETMIAAAKEQGLSLNLQSGYRSYAFQVSLYDRYVQQQGKSVADTQSARPGYSEHQTGWAADLGSVSHPNCDVENCFADTAEGKWLAANAHTYGFVIRYLHGKDSTTGYIYEPWHVRYVGTALATEVYNQGNEPLETFFGLPGAPNYP
jgi:D-alanyl-D-alanine carboxypeptidase